MAIDDRELEGDSVFEDRGVRIVIDKMSLPLLSGSQIDYVENMMGGGFTVNNPNATTLLSELARWQQLPARDALVVHISAHAMADAQGKIHILPADASVDKPLTWVPLKDVLHALSSNQAKQKRALLVRQYSCLRSTYGHLMLAPVRELRSGFGNAALLQGAHNPRQESF